MANRQPQLPVRKLISIPKITIGSNVKQILKNGRTAINLPKGIKITSIKTIKPPTSTITQQDSPNTIKRKEEDHLRAQLTQEIEQRSRMCAHLGYECNQPVVCGRDYCIRHILADGDAPYKQCIYVYANSQKRCPNAVPMSQYADSRKDHGLCFDHAYTSYMSRIRNAAPAPVKQTAESMLLSLSHYVKPERTTSCASTISVVSDPETEVPTAHQPIDPFKQVNATNINMNVSNSLMECRSDSDSDADVVTVCDRSVNGMHEDSSDPEETAYDGNPMRYAGIFTAEEVVAETRNCLKQLQGCYLKQMSGLRHMLRRARAKYLRELKAEREKYCSIHTQMSSNNMSVKERRQMLKLKAYLSYRKKLGVEAVLARKLYHKRAQMSNSTPLTNRGVVYGRCVFSEGGVRCSAHSIPAARHCLKHILCDTQQVLFVECGDPRSAGSVCREPVAMLPAQPEEHPHCYYHTDLPSYTVFNVKKDGSDTDDSETETETEFQNKSREEVSDAERAANYLRNTMLTNDTSDLNGFDSIVDSFVGTDYDE